MTNSEINEKMNLLYTEKMNLEARLAGGDYKIIKCAEAQAAGDGLPYDASSLHQQRQQWRDRINAIEQEIAELKQQEPEDAEAVEEEGL
jgi:hypothetical protein